LREQEQSSNCCWLSPAQSFLVSGLLGTHDDIYIRSKTTLSLFKLGLIFDERKVLTAALDYRRLLTEFVLNKIYRFNLNLTGNTLSLRYKDQPVSAVQENHFHSVGRRHNFNILKQVVHVVTIRL
jgi:hypothetical protein